MKNREKTGNHFLLTQNHEVAQPTTAMNTSRQSKIAVVLFTLATLFWGALSISKATAQDQSASSSVAMSLRPSSIYEGESTVLSIRVTNIELDAEPKLDSLKPDFEIEALQPSSQTSVQSYYDGSNQRRIETKTMEYRFRLSPKKHGTFTIKSPSMESGGRPLSAESVVLTVNESSQTNLVLLETRVSPGTEVFPLVPFEVSTDVLIKEAPEKYKSVDQLSVIVNQIGPPRLVLPWLQSQSIVEKTIPDVPIEEWLERIQNDDGGFVINNFQHARDPFIMSFSFFDEKREALFLPKAERVERTTDNGTKVGYLRYSFKRTYRASSSGSLEFGKATLRGSFIDFSNPDEPKPQQIYLSNNSTIVSVKEIPEQDAPENYIGIYGSLEQKTELSSNEATVGDALSLTLSYIGYGVFDGAKAPDLKETFAKAGFKVYPATQRSLENGVAFDYKIRPTAQGNLEIPSVKISYFNVEQGKYVEERSEPIKVSVEESALPSSDETSPKSDASEFSQTEVSHSSDQEQKIIGIALKISSIIAAILTLGLAFSGARFLTRWNAERVVQGNRQIVRIARNLLERGLERLETSPLEGLQFVRIAFVQLIGKFFKQSPDALTDAEIVNFFESELNETIREGKRFRLNSGEELANREAMETLKRLRDFFQDVEKIRFGGNGFQDDRFATNVTELFERWVQFLLRQTKSLSTIVRLNDLKRSQL